MKSVLVTGATGYVGRKVVVALLEEKNVQIAIVVRNIEKAKCLLDNSKIKFIDSKKDGWREEIKEFNPEIVIHLAAYLTSSDGKDDINKLIEANIIFGSHLLDSLKCCDLKYFVNTGTFAEYSKDYFLVPAYFYAATKTAFKSILKYYQNLMGFKLINAIPYTIYGGSKEGKKVIDHLFESQKCQIKMSPGDQVLDFIHIEDVIAFYIKVVKDASSLIDREYTFFLGTGRGTTLKEVATIIEEQYHISLDVDWGGIDYRPTDIMYAVAPTEKNKKIFWETGITLEKGVLKYY